MFNRLCALCALVLLKTLALYLLTYLLTYLLVLPVFKNTAAYYIIFNTFVEHALTFITGPPV